LVEYDNAGNRKMIKASIYYYLKQVSPSGAMKEESKVLPSDVLTRKRR
jgi:hypothetical protein